MLVSLLMLLCFVSSLMVLYSTSLLETWGVAACTYLCIAVTVLSGLGFVIGRQRKHWLKRDQPAPSERIRLKCWSLAAGLLALLLYALIISRLDFLLYSHLFSFFLEDYLLVLPLILLGLPFYVRWADRRQSQPEDAYFRIGMAFTRKRPWSWGEHKKLLLVWAVKIVFIPFMYGGLVVSVGQLLEMMPSMNPNKLIAWMFLFGLSFDLLIGSIGYLFASEMLGTEVRSTDDTWEGWLVCMLCYPPLLTLYRILASQADDIVWNQWLTPAEPLYWLWAVLITLSWLIYWLSNASFGFIFSNLSWRGLIDHGPYRFSKHPSYISKNIYWWLYTVPFVGVDNWLDLCRNFLALSFVSLMYYLRAKTEERHLMRFPEYVAYAEHIAQYGLIARIKQLFLGKLSR